jgi:hypothetical protein
METQLEFLDSIASNLSKRKLSPEDLQGAVRVAWQSRSDAYRSKFDYSLEKFTSAIYESMKKQAR